MAYYLTVEKRKGEYTPLEITKSKYFARISNLKNNGATLEEIDIFTMMFNDEHELRKTLFKEKLLEMRDTNRPLSIRRLINNKYKKVTYDFLYQGDMEDVMDPSRIIDKINDKLYQNDFRFIEKLANHYMEYYECSSTAPEVRNYACESIRLGHISPYFSIRDNNQDNVLTRMAKLLIYEYKELPNGNIIYSNKVKYRNIHSLIAFIKNYNKKYQDEENKQISLFEEDKPITKKRKKNEPLDGQYSLFD